MENLLEKIKKIEALVEEITDNLISKIHKHEDEDLIHGNLK